MSWVGQLGWRHGTHRRGGSQKGNNCFDDATATNGLVTTIPGPRLVACLLSQRAIEVDDVDLGAAGDVPQRRQLLDTLFERLHQPRGSRSAQVLFLKSPCILIVHAITIGQAREHERAGDACRGQQTPRVALRMCGGGGVPGRGQRLSLRRRDTRQGQDVPGC